MPRASGLPWRGIWKYAEAEIDNNSIEHALRNVVMGRKNWFHVGQEAGGERAANLVLPDDQLATGSAWNPTRISATSFPAYPAIPNGTSGN